MTYAGDLTPTQVWEKILGDTPAFLIDVRTRAEWTFVGVAALPEGKPPMVGQEWQVFPQMGVDPNFAQTLSARLEDLGAQKDSELFFLCRSGVRSLAAAEAVTALGYAKCYNITGGFEGDLDQQGHRGNSNGWKAEGLPWQQA